MLCRRCETNRRRAAAHRCGKAVCFLPSPCDVWSRTYRRSLPLYSSRILRPGHVGSLHRTSFCERVARGVQRLPQGGHLGPVVSPTHQAAISMYGVVGFTPLHWLSWFLTDPTGWVSLGCHGLSPQGKKGRRGRDAEDLCEQAIGESSRCMGRSTRIQRDPRTDINRFVQRDPAVCRHAPTMTHTRTHARTRTQPD